MKIEPTMSSKTIVPSARAARILFHVTAKSADPRGRVRACHGT
jgi:hypothetical protein